MVTIGIKPFVADTPSPILFLTLLMRLGIRAPMTTYAFESILLMYLGSYGGDPESELRAMSAIFPLLVGNPG